MVTYGNAYTHFLTNGIVSQLFAGVNEFLKFGYKFIKIKLNLILTLTLFNVILTIVKGG